MNKKHIYSSEKMSNLDKCIYDYVYLFFGEDFYSNALY